MARKKIDDNIKKGIIGAHKEGLTQKKIAEKFGISTTSVSRIIKSHASGSHQPKGKKSKNKSERLRRIEAVEKRILQLEEKIDSFIAKW
ncbi:helix-turn-helix domain-containing protein [Thermodesulfobacteriota bacterium]